MFHIFFITLAVWLPWQFRQVLILHMYKIACWEELISASNHKSIKHLSSRASISQRYLSDNILAPLILHLFIIICQVQTPNLNSYSWIVININWRLSKTKRIYFRFLAHKKNYSIYLNSKLPLVFLKRPHWSWGDICFRDSGVMYKNICYISQWCQVSRCIDDQSYCVKNLLYWLLTSRNL